MFGSSQAAPENEPSKSKKRVLSDCSNQIEVAGEEAKQSKKILLKTDHDQGPEAESESEKNDKILQSQRRSLILQIQTKLL